MKRAFDNRTLVTLSLIAGLLLAGAAQAQLGSGWVETTGTFTKAIHLDGDSGDPTTFPWSPYQANCSPTICADYSYDSATDTETFRILDGRSNRSEIRLYNDYTSGRKQFEGYLTFYAPLQDESLFQIFGHSVNATLTMIRGYNDSVGRIFSTRGNITLATNCYAIEKRINVIHYQDQFVKIYVDGVLAGEFAETDTTQNYWKWGCYGTPSTNVPAVVKWRAVRTFTDGVIPAEAPPSTPTGLTATTVSSSRIDLSWTASSGASSYNVKRATTSGGPYATIATGVTATSYADSGLAVSTTYYYVVSAVNGLGESANSTEASATTSAPTVPAAPTGLAAAPGNTQVSLSWAASLEATSYNVKRATLSGGPYATIATGIATTAYADTGLINGTTYYYVVSGVNGVGEGPNSAEASTTPNALAPVARYTFDDGTASDSSGYGNHGTLQGTAAVINDLQRGNVLSLDGTGGKVDLGNPASLDITGPITVMVWVNTDAAGGGTNRNIVNRGHGGSPTRELTFRADATSNYDFGSYESGAGTWHAATPIPAGDVGANTWVHLAGTWDGTQWNLYRNAILENSFADANGPLAMTVGWAIGARGGISGFERVFDGRMDDVRIYNIALSQAEIQNAMAGCTVPASPTALTATGGNRQVALSWAASSGATSYNVKRSGSSSGPYTTVATGVTTTSHIDAGLSDGTTYYYVISAVNSCGESANSAYRGATTIPAVPTGLTAAAVSTSQINLSWTASSGATSYNVRRATVSGGPYTVVATGVTTASYNDMGLSASTAYYYVVSAINSSGESADSAEASATTQTPAPPPAPTGLTATPGNNQVSLSWIASSTATSYNVKRATASGGPYTTIASEVTATSYTDTTAVNGTTYFYVVSAVNANGESANSAEAVATPSAPTIPAAPTGLTATAGKKKVTLNWTQSASPNITQNKVYRATTSGGPYTLVTTLSATTSYNNTGLTSGTTYYYVVTAVDSNGFESPYSNQANATAR